MISNDNPHAGNRSQLTGQQTLFSRWPTTAEPAALGKRLAEVFSRERLENEPAQYAKHYRVACTWYGSLLVSSLLGERALLAQLIAKYQPYRDSWRDLLAGPGHVDQNVFGVVPLEISLHSDDPVYLSEGLALADHQRAHLDCQKRFAIDDMFMITALQVQAHRASGAPEYLETAATTLLEYLDRLQQSDGLFHHHHDFCYKWGRGNGWVAAGMTELLRELPETHASYLAIRAGYRKMMEGLLVHQLSDGPGAGLWQQVLDVTDSRNWPETSASAMFSYALVSGVRHGWLEADRYAPAARRSWLALAARVTAGGLLQDVSEWAYLPSSHPEGPSYEGDETNYYFERPRLTGNHHGQAPLLWSATALMRPRAG